MDPDLFRSELEKKKENAEAQQKQIANGELPSGTVVKTADQVQEEIISFLAEKLEIKEETVRSAMEENTQYKILKTQVEKPVADEIIAFMDENSLNSIQIEEDTKRYYPQDELAASVIGFTNGDGDGQYGIEYQYDDYLSGTDGKVISAKDAYGNEMPYRYAKTYEAQDGNSVYLTIDRTLQYSLEKNLEETVSQFEINFFYFTYVSINMNRNYSTSFIGNQIFNFCNINCKIFSINITKYWLKTISNYSMRC